MAWTIHQRKIWPVYFEQYLRGIKPFEIRIEDRGRVEVDDMLFLREWNPETGEYTGDAIKRVVVNVWRGISGLRSDYCIMTTIGYNDKETTILVDGIRKSYQFPAGPVLEELTNMEELAELEHLRWAGQARKALFDLTEERRERWTRQAATAYKDLTEEEKEQDREQVRRTLSRLRSAVPEGKVLVDAGELAELRAFARISGYPE